MPEALGEWRAGEREAYDVAAATVITARTLVATYLGGLVPAGTNVDEVVVGRAEQYRNNSTGALGDLRCEVLRTGETRWENSAGGEALTDTDVGGVCYVVSPTQVSNDDATGTRAVAGKVSKVESDGVWIQVAYLHGELS